MSNILTVLEQRSLRQLCNSARYSDLHEESITRRSQQVKALLRGEGTQPSISLEAQTLRSLYYSMLEDYKGKGFTFETAPTKRSESLWKRVDAACKEVGCHPKKFMRAQFSWFHKTFGCAPELSQLATSAAVARAQEFTGHMEHRIVGNNLGAEVDLASSFRQSEKLLRDMMRAQGCKTREDFYRRFVLTEIFMFPSKFLNADPAYRRAMNVG